MLFNINKFIVNKVLKKDNTISFEYEVIGDIKKFFWLGEFFNVTYKGEDSNRYGFTYDEKARDRMIKYMNEEEIPDNVKMLWKDISNNLKNKKKYNKFQNDATFILDLEFIKEE